MKKLYTPAELLDAEKKDAKLMAKAATDALLPSLSGDALTIAQDLIRKHGHIVLFAATEAVSLLIQRYENRHKGELLYLSLQGHLCDGTMGISIDSEAITLEIARYTDLWEDENVEDEDLNPSKDAEKLLSWIFKALEQQPNLLRHFSAVKQTSGQWIRLDPLSSKDRKDDPVRRWAKK